MRPNLSGAGTFQAQFEYEKNASGQAFAATERSAWPYING